MRSRTLTNEYAAALVHDRHRGQHLSPHRRPVRGRRASAHLLELLAHEAPTALCGNDDRMGRLHFVGGVAADSGVRWNNPRSSSY